MRHICIFLFCAVTTISCAAVDHISFVAVDGTAKLAKRVARENLYPWISRQQGDEIIISNACGFVDITYEIYAPDQCKGGDYWNGRGLMGEWCEVQEFVLESPTLVQFQAWDGVNYILNSTLIFVDGHEKPFVAYSDFIEEAELQNFVEDIDDPANGTGCFDSKNSWYADIHELGAVKDFGSQRCFTKGVYLGKINNIR